VVDSVGTKTGISHVIKETDQGGSLATEIYCSVCCGSNVQPSLLTTVSGLSVLPSIVTSVCILLNTNHYRLYSPSSSFNCLHSLTTQGLARLIYTTHRSSDHRRIGCQNMSYKRKPTTDERTGPTWQHQSRRACLMPNCSSNQTWTADGAGTAQSQGTTTTACPTAHASRLSLGHRFRHRTNRGHTMPVASETFAPGCTA